MKKVLFIIFLLMAIAGFAQNKNLNFYQLSVENGLPKRTPSNAIQDKYGYIWAATGAGLVRYDGYNTKIYLTELGIGFLSQPSEIYQDHEGELWVGTIYKGLFRYDRAADTFKQIIYYPRDSDSAANHIIAIQEDGSGNIWAISENGGRSKYFVNCYNKKSGEWQHYGNSDSGIHHIDATAYYSLLEDHEGHIWIGTDNGIYNYDSISKRFVGYRVSKDSVQQFHGFSFLYQPPSEPDIIWMDFGTNANTISNTAFDFHGLLRFNTSNHTFTTYRNIAGDTAGNNEPLVPLEDKRGRLWMGTLNGLLLFNQQTGSFTNYPTNAKGVNTIGRAYVNCEEDNAGNIWYSSSLSGLFYFNTQNKTFTHYLADPDDPVKLQSNLIGGLMTDKTGTLWLSEANGGLQWINKTTSIFTVYPDKSETKNNYSYGSVSCYAEDADGNIWMGTAKGLVYWNRRTDSFKLVKPFYQQFYAEQINCIIIDKDGLIWYGTTNGLVCYNPATGSKKNYLSANSKGVTIITCIYEDHEGIIWIGTTGRGLYSLNPPTGKIIHYPLRPFSSDKNNNSVSKQLSSWVVYVINGDSNGNLWIGTNSGLNRFNRMDSTFTVFMNQSKGFTRIRTISEDKKGLLWLGTWEGGLFHFNPATDTMQQFMEKQGLLFNAVYSCLPDSAGMFWLTSPRGITRFDPATHFMRPITTANGLPAVNIDYGGFKTSDGDFLVSTSNGFIQFNPAQFTPDTDAPLTHIETISFPVSQKDNKLLKDSTLLVFGRTKIDLRYDENRISFHYIGIHFQNAAMTQYAYKLDGYDKNWIQAGTERSVTYTNLSPGTYTFYIKAANSDGVWSKEVSIVVIIHPPWWQTWWAYILYAVILIAGIWGFINYRSRNLKRRNKVLEQKVSERTDELKQSLENLKSTQSQLIQSEKMASLGELTAGIAHEIQNPLNFVNNFSDINKELLNEMKDEMSKGNLADANEIANDVMANEEKINHHGKRADAIVKSMLEHSRTSSGKKEPTDINALADEYLRLSYHGMRAKDKTFNCEMKTEFDESLQKINVVPQDIGRVLLNLFNNAFYACAERSRASAGSADGYVPTVTLVTRKENNHVTITVTDNGPGIPSNIKDKIFQPFFTTKPTGQGTGLGLSLSYDIVTKEHGGTIKVESVEGEGTEFIIRLPVS